MFRPFDSEKIINNPVLESEDLDRKYCGGFIAESAVGSDVRQRTYVPVFCKRSSLRERAPSSPPWQESRGKPRSAEPGLWKFRYARVK